MSRCPEHVGIAGVEAVRICHDVAGLTYLKPRFNVCALLSRCPEHVGIAGVEVVRICHDVAG
ncbi:hypothetical protein V6259_17590 [Marinomonas sp. TI.3.20]|uniref:hypothetical protein n=1 Tax=Marinomonas sp. TI.3.20 TaxID=3121296 RepID=UPI00311E02CD